MINQMVYTHNGAEYCMDASPFIEKDRTYVPVRFLAQALGVQDDNLLWDAESKTITMISEQGVKLELTIGNPEMKISNGSLQSMESYMGVEPIIKEGRTFLPAYFIANQFGYGVRWDQATQTVIMTK